MKALFGAHETFHIREGWLRKGLLGIQKNSNLFSGPYASDVLGVGHNMVVAIRYWLQATNLAERKLEQRDGKNIASYHLTKLAELILAQDPYFEDDGTLWALHYQLATNQELATTWYWAFNEFGVRQFTQDLFLSHLQRYVETKTRRKVNPKTLEKDFRCLTRTYAQHEDKVKEIGYEDSYDCPLASLNLIQHLPLSRGYRLVGPSQDELPPLLVCYALTEMRFRFSLLGDQASLREVQTQIGSPGRVFALDSDALYEYLLRLESEHNDLISFSRTAGLNLIMFKPVDSLQVLNQYYQRARTLEGVHV
ncbi:MAG: hypothetical protein JW384_03516 [Nitrosomonadaceae bacterium]|nr:hypothetical protein [Nitrosomonadaceae bacterium]